VVRARAAIAAYVHDSGEMARVAQVFRGFLGDRASYAGFEYRDLDWQCDPAETSWYSTQQAA
jgi:hypothetical protein